MTLKGRCIKCIMRLFSIFPINRRKIVFESFGGVSASDSPRAIYDQMIKLGYDFQWVWLVNDKKIFRHNCVTAHPLSIRALYHLATAQLWIDNFRKRSWVAKRKEQFYVQTWHGCGVPTKKCEAQTADKLSRHYVENAINDSKMADLFLSGSRIETERYRKFFWYDGNILEKGIPAVSMYYENCDKYYARIVTEFHVDNGDHFLLYAPTFRENENTDSYLKDFDKIRETLTQKYGGVWRVLVRLHPNAIHLQDRYQYDEWVLNASNYGELGDLIMASDLVISDYSGSAYYGIAAGKRTLLYMPDRDAYENERGIYIKLNEMPFLIAQTYAQLMDNIKSFDDSVYQRSIKEFSDRIGLCNSEKSATVVTEYIIEHMYDNRRK